MKKKEPKKRNSQTKHKKQSFSKSEKKEEQDKRINQNKQHRRSFKSEKKVNKR